MSSGTATPVTMDFNFATTYCIYYNKKIIKEEM